MADSLEVAKVKLFNMKVNSLLKRDVYLSRKNYARFCDGFVELAQKIRALKKPNTLAYFAESNHADKQLFLRFLSDFEDLTKADGSYLVNRHNEDFLNEHLEKEKDYLDNVSSK